MPTATFLLVLSIVNFPFLFPQKSDLAGRCDVPYEIAQRPKIRCDKQMSLASPLLLAVSAPTHRPDVR